jgi:protein-S-isoprenylcysteine O-methyltransferase Ste14
MTPCCNVILRRRLAFIQYLAAALQLFLKLLTVLGEAVLAASLPLLGLFAVALIVNVLYIPLSEEPGLAKRFGEEYEVYRRNVPRWIPRLRSWPTDPPGQDTTTS